MSVPSGGSTLADLLRLGACWLAALVLLQALAAAHALGQGPLHRHRDAPAPALAGVQGHVHAHAQAERHDHGAADAGVWLAAGGVVDDAVAGIDHAAFALTAALALMLAAVGARALPDRRRHVWRAAPAWAWRTTVPAGPRRPPRRG